MDEKTQGPSEHLSTAELLDFYRLAQDVRKYHHSALWEIEKHFTWWLSILLGAMFLLLANSRVLDKTVLALGLSLTAAFGAVISAIGCVVVRKEGRYFSESLQVCNRVAKALGLDLRSYTGQQRRDPGSAVDQLSFTLHPSNYFVSEFEGVARTANKSFSRLMLVLSPSLNVRDYFQLVFAASLILFVLLLVSVAAGVICDRGPLTNMFRASAQFL